MDELVFARLARLGIQTANPCSDAVFLRRAYVDVIGTLPSVEEASQFLADPDPDRRAALIERLLSRDEFADYWALKWGDLLRVKSEFPINLWPNANFGRLIFELADPPAGVEIGGVQQFGTEVTLTLRCRPAVGKPGTKGNLIVNMFAERVTPASDKALARVARVGLGVLPAIPFEVVQP